MFCIVLIVIKLAFSALSLIMLLTGLQLIPLYNNFIDQLAISQALSLVYCWRLEYYAKLGDLGYEWLVTPFAKFIEAIANSTRSWALWALEVCQSQACQAQILWLRLRILGRIVILKFWNSMYIWRPDVQFSMFICIYHDERKKKKYLYKFS